LEWDRDTYSTDDLNCLLRSFFAIQTKPAWFALFWVHIFDVVIVRDALFENGYTNIYVIHWHKPNVTAHSKKDVHVNAMEVLVTARFELGAPEPLTTSISSNPLEQHNFITADGTNNFRVNAAGDKINVCQKSLQVYEHLLPLYVKPGARILVCGFGAGGEIGACIAGGYDCVAFENDPVQFYAVSNWLRNYYAPKLHTPKKQVDPKMEEKKQASPLASSTDDTKEAKNCQECATHEDHAYLEPCNRCGEYICWEVPCSAEEPMGGIICGNCIRDPSVIKEGFTEGEIETDNPGEEEKTPSETE
jgi:hypothetical protein